MRRTLVAAGVAALLETAIVATPALAARPEVNKQSCADRGGTFANGTGTKSCTTTTTEAVTGEPVSIPATLGDCSSVCSRYLVGYRVDQAVRITTVDSQRGNGDVTTTSTTTVLSSTVVPLSCEEEDYLGGVQVSSEHQPTQVCADRGLYPVL